MLTGFRRLADPRISLASVASLFLGTCYAFHEGPLDLPLLALTWGGILALEVAKNASGEVFDWDSGADRFLRPDERTPFSGGKRVLVDGLLTRRQTWAIAAAGYALCVLAGVVLTAVRGPVLLALGALGVACAWSYHAPPLRLSYRGWGEAAVALCYGPLIAEGAYLVQRGTFSGPLLATAIPLGLLIAAFLWVNEFPDARADAEAGKRNLVVALGRHRAARALPFLYAAAFASPGTPLPAVAALLPALRACRTVIRHGDEAQALVPAQQNALRAFLVYALVAGLSIYW